MVKFLPFLSLATTATASFVVNLNYRSPSHFHPGLGVSIRKVAARNTPDSAWNSSQLNFTHGVASGDPYDTSVILWTRAAPSMDDDRSNITVSGNVPLYSHETEEYVKASKAPVCVGYKVATDAAMTNCVDSGTAYTSSDIDYTVKVEAKNLKAYTQYCEFFNVLIISGHSDLIHRLPIQHLQLGQCKSYWTNQDNTEQG
jgi:alkaline phosphatase D